MQLFLLLLLFVQLHQVAMVTAMSGCQDGRDKDHRLSKNCKAAGLSDVPAGFDPKTKVLLFPNNLFSSLSWSSFQFFTEIYEIDLTDNKIPEVTPSDSPLLPTLSVLRLGLNHLTSLSDRSFSACPALTELYLNNNTIQSLSDQTFSGLSKLQILDLSSNHIKVLPGSMLHPLPAIEFLYINDNKIKLLPNDWFSKKEDVPYLFFSDNPWNCTCSNLYLINYIKELDFNFYITDGVRLSTVACREEGDATKRADRSKEGEGGDATEREDRAKEGEAGKVGSIEPLLVTLKPTGGGATGEEEERGGREERGVYRKTLYRQIRKEEAIEGWRDVVEECRVSAEDEGRRGGAQDEDISRERTGGVSRKRYRVILREQREEAGGGSEELDWVLGGWEVKRGAEGREDREGPRSSWGEWLEHYLPRLPWGVTTPSEEEVAE
ncbi:uncharacterized protein LKV04_022008 [Tautogolabrus adspersus]